MPKPVTPALTVDCVIYDASDRVLLIRRGNEPFKGGYALPGGFVEIGETVETACRREVKEEAGLDLGPLRLLGVYSDPKRDPRFHTVSVVYVAHVPQGAAALAGSDAASVEWVKDWRKLDLAFDHAKILADAEALMTKLS